jgi:hypothetical protein
MLQPAGADTQEQGFTRRWPTHTRTFFTTIWDRHTGGQDYSKQADTQEDMFTTSWG